MSNKKIVDINSFKKQKAINAYKTLSPELKRYIKLVKRDFKNSDKIPWSDIPENLHEMVMLLDDKDLDLD